MAQLAKLAVWLLFAYPLAAGGQTVRLQLTVLNVEDDRPLSYVSLQLLPGGTGGVTDEEGNLTLTVQPGTYTLRASYTGYATFAEEFTLNEDTEATLRLEPTAEQLQTVTVTDGSDREKLRRARMGVESLSAGELESIPNVFGELDVLKSLQTLAGVASAGEASNGISVRGGTIDQNLLLYDGAPIFTPTHLFGVFTVFTPDAIGGVDLYRGNVPARFGGRIASVLDVRSKSPNEERTEINGGIGLVSSNLSVDTPLGKRFGLLLATRGSFTDFFFPLVDRLKNTESRFADATLRLTYRPGPRDNLSLTGFYSQDFYQVDLLSNIGGLPATANQYAYLTLNGGLRWLHLFGDELSLHVDFNRANYQPELRFPQTSGERVDFLSSITSTLGTVGLNYTQRGHRLAAGLQHNLYELAPGQLDPRGVQGINPVELEQETGRELGLYAEDEWTVSDRLNLSLGLRFVLYRQLGPGEIRNYEPGGEITAGNLIGRTPVGKGEAIATYRGLEPRFGASYRVGDGTSFKVSYARSRQYLQNIYNATTPLPTSRWKVSDPNVGPQTADLYAVGLSHLTDQERHFLQLEVYYRRTADLLEYKPGANFFLNPAVETDLLRGQGRGYGIEVSARQATGRFTGELNYAYARSLNQVTGAGPNARINRGAWYPGYFDQPHTFNANLTFDREKTHELGFNLVVQSNRPYTVPNGFVTVRDTPIPLFLERNNARLPLYHRLDFSWTINNLSRVKRKWTGKWVFTVYNVYGRDNAYNVFFQAKTGTTPALGIFARSPFAAYRLSIFGAPILSLAYKFHFVP